MRVENVRQPCRGRAALPWVRRRALSRRRHAGDARRQRGRRRGRRGSCAAPTRRCRRSSCPATRVSIGAGVTMAQVIAHIAISPFCTPVARCGRRAGGARRWRTVGGNLFAPRPMAISPSRCWRSMRAWWSPGRPAPRRAARRGAARPRRRVGLVAADRRCRARVSADAFRYLQGQPGQAEGHARCCRSRRICRVERRAHPGAARRLWRDGSDADAGERRSNARWKGRRSMQAAIARAAQVAAEGFDPPTDAIASAWYRREVAGVHLDGCWTAWSEADGQDTGPVSRSTARTARPSSRTAQNLLMSLRRGVGDLTPKYGCGQGTCGACTVLIDGEPHLSCLTLAEAVQGRHVETPAGLPTGQRCIRCRTPSWSISRRNAATARRAC